MNCGAIFSYIYIVVCCFFFWIPIQANSDRIAVPPIKCQSSAIRGGAGKSGTAEQSAK